MTSNYSKLLAVSLIINILFASAAYYAVWHWRNLRIEINRLSESYRKLEQELNLTKTQLEYYKKQAEYYSSLISSGAATKGVIGHASIPVVAVRTVQRGFNVQYEGVVMTADVELREGKGRILVNTIPKIGIDVQTSVTTAVKVAERVTGVSLGKTDVVLTIKAFGWLLPTVPSGLVTVICRPPGTALLSILIFTLMTLESVTSGVLTTVMP